MSTEWKYAFLNSFIIIFCLMYSLNIPHSNQNLSSFSWFLSSVAYHLATFPRMVWFSNENNFDISFRVILLLPRETDLCLVQDKVHSLFIVLGSQAKRNWVSNVYCYVKSIRETLAQLHLIGHRFFVNEPIWNVFYLLAAIFEIPM